MSNGVDLRVCGRCSGPVECQCDPIPGCTTCLRCIRWFGEHKDATQSTQMLHIHATVYHRRKLPQKVLVLAVHDLSLDDPSIIEEQEEDQPPVKVRRLEESMALSNPKAPILAPVGVEHESVPISFRQPFMEENDVGWVRRTVRGGDRVCINGRFGERPGSGTWEFYAEALTVVDRFADHHQGKEKGHALAWRNTGLQGRPVVHGANTATPQAMPCQSNTQLNPSSADCNRGMPICRQWAYYNRCTNKNCVAAHPDMPVAHRRQLYMAAVQQRKTAHIQLHGLEEKKFRARVFADWLVVTFGTELLNLGTGVLDVAGAGGDLSFQLRVRHGVHCTVVDPRDPQKLTRDQARQLKEEAQRPYIHPRRKEFLRPEPPPRITEFFGPALLCGASSVPPGHRGYCSSQWGAPPANTEAALALLGCSVVVGMHPDQATEPITDFAVLYGKPFAVVPCCVFSAEFPDRQLSSGAFVEGYDQFVEYLSAKHPSCQCARLPLQGASTVVFKRGTV
uniref:C3H1-type domain-containing protein n=1 Tax=Eutreptiella gymnastica TaxID=73025 RepID=A0A7S1I7R7_9EUGL|mmetsp:Transcript_136110/g.236107  ORF Transcript_136110/g.236107 Transcript_136110/m.236107 type:complete len:507 (+) Transcript_136110:51-1571(+)